MIFNSRLKNVYGIPTILGLVLSGLIGLSIWFSIANDSSTERLLLVAMLVVSVIHLLEASYSFRLLEIHALMQSPVFCGEEAVFAFELRNTSSVSTESCWIRFRKSRSPKPDWMEIAPLPANSSRIISLRTTLADLGSKPIPIIQLKSYADSGFHRFWRYVDTRKEVVVLPAPVDHGMVVTPEDVTLQNEELSSLEEIHDPSRFKFTDPKLFQRTGRRYQRVFHSRQASSQVAYNWEELKHLSHKQRGEQFSFWIKDMERLKSRTGSSASIKVQAPFITLDSPAGAVDLRLVKTRFGKWFYEQA